MKRYCKKGLAIILSFIMIFSCTQGSIYADNSASMSTESIDDDSEATVNGQVYFVQLGTNKVITLDGVMNNPIDCKTVYGGSKESIPSNGLFTIYYGNWDGKAVVNFTNAGNDKSWRSNGDSVVQMEKRTNPGGWESVRMEPQGDGTIAFKSSPNDKKYFTVNKESQLSTVELDLQHDEKVSSNEKFVLYTDTVPKTVKKVSVSNIAGDAATLSWEGVTECLYCGYEVLYSTSENGTYKSAGQTADTSMEITGLQLSTKYYFKVRTLTNNKGGVYADSKIAYASTLSDYKPAKTEGVEAKASGNSVQITWNKTERAKAYKIYRGESRFSEYKEIGTSTTTSYTDTSPNGSKYNNYYKISGYNDASEGALSDPSSIEISMFGPNMYIFSEKDDPAEINKITAKVFESQHYNQFGKERYALAYKPGDYTKTEGINVGYYTQILGLGKTPYDVKLNNVRAPSALTNNNATCNFWVGIENVSIPWTESFWSDDTFFNFQWSVSQAAPARRLYVERKTTFDWWFGWASGGFVADSLFTQQVGSYSQQQYYYRNCQMKNGVYGINWNQVVQGCNGISSGNSSDNTGQSFGAATNLISNVGKSNWKDRGCTTLIEKTPVIREKPFLYFDTESDSYKVFIPSLRKNSQGITWSKTGMGQGTAISVDKCFYIANPDKDTAQTINRQLAAGKNILFSPGTYYVDSPINVTRENTVLLGLGLATIIPTNSEAAIKTADVGGISIAGLILDAGTYSKTLLTVGDEGCNKDHSENPTVLQDVIYRVGGTSHVGVCDSCEVINSNDVIIDHTWIWRADHGENVGWNINKAKNGLIVNGNNITAYGLFCEHFQEYDIIWRGENGTTYFLQNEKCYDPQSQSSWMSHNGTKKGYASYKVTDNVKNHYAVGLGIYDVFINTNGASIFLDNAIEVPNTPNVLIENACIVEIADGNGPLVGINHIVNNTTVGITTGKDSGGGYAIQRLLSYCNEASTSLGSWYADEFNTEVINEVGESPKIDTLAEKDIVKEAASKDTETPLWQMTDNLFDKKAGGSGVIEDPTTRVVETTATPTTTVTPTTTAKPITTAKPVTTTASSTTTAKPVTTTVAPTTQSQQPVTTASSETTKNTETSVTTEQIPESTLDDAETTITDEPTAIQETTVLATKGETTGQNNVTTASDKKTTPAGIKVANTKVKKAIKKITAKKISITLKKVKGVTGYQVKVSYSKKFGKSKTITKKYKKAKFVVKKLKAGKKYYVKARAYKIVGSETYYGKWTKPKTAKMKK